MIYYIDFDSTLYDTSYLIKDMLNQLAADICKYTNEGITTIKEKITKTFNKENIYNIYKLADFFAKEYGINSTVLIDNIEKIILNGKKYVYEDSIDFLKFLNEKGNQIYILTYASKDDISYQLSKIKGSGLTEYIYNIIITSNSKGDLNLEYKNGVFIDDNVKELKCIYENNPKMIIRMRRKNNKHSLEELNMKNDNIIEIDSFKNFNVDTL